MSFSSLELTLSGNLVLISECVFPLTSNCIFDRLMLGFMMVGMFLSFWISNSGVTAMLIPIVEAVVQELFQVC